MFKVLESNPLNQNPPTLVFENNFTSFNQAKQAVKKYLGVFNIPDNWNGSPYDFSGYGYMIEIREIATG